MKKDIRVGPSWRSVGLIVIGCTFVATLVARWNPLVLQLLQKWNGSIRANLRTATNVHRHLRQIDDRPTNEWKDLSRHSVGRDLTNIESLSDPKTVLQKPENQQRAVGDWRYPLNPATLQRPISILSFGNSQTWGAGLDDRHQAYPWMLGEPDGTVDNVAIRATGADYPSVCLQSMIPDAENKNYDVITLQYNLCYSDGFELLINTLRERYPDAIIIFIHLWFLTNVVYEEDSGKTTAQLGKDPEVKWSWANSGDHCKPPSVTVPLVEKAGGYVYKFPLPESPRVAIDNGWFQSDWHHISDVGHLIVTNDILNLLSQHQEDLFKPKKLGSFGLGDQCMSWFEDGGTGLGVEIDGVKIEEEATLLGPAQFSKKYAVEIDPVKGATIAFENNHPIPVPVGLSCLSKQEGRRYTVMRAKINNNDPVTIDPNYNSDTDPTSHLSVLHQIGFARPGKNYILLSTLEAREKPFSVTGIVLCGVCAETGKLGDWVVMHQS
jgi:hypothetical protein